MKRAETILAVLVLAFTLIVSTAKGYTFGEWAIDNALPNNATLADARSTGITSVEGVTGYTSLKYLYLSYNPITELQAGDFAGLNDLLDLRLDGTEISSIETGTFSNMQKLTWLYLNDNLPITTLNLSGAQFRDLTFFTIKQLNILATVDLTNAEIGSQQTFDSLMSGGGAAFVGFRDVHHAPITEINFAGADLTAVTELDYMFLMDTLETLNLANVAWAASVINNNYVEVLDLVYALETKSLNFLTIDEDLYTARQSFFDDWDAAPYNELTVIPEPSTILFLGFAGFLLLKNSRK